MGYNRHITEVLLCDEIIEYDACSSSSFDEACEFYKNKYDYIGASKTLYVCGVASHYDKDLYFFRYHSKDNKNLLRRIKLKKLNENR